MTLVYTLKLGFRVRKTNVGAQKIDKSPLETFDIVIVSFLLQNNLEKARFFQEPFLLTNTSMEMVLEMLFLTFSEADVCFAEKKLE